MVGQQPEIVFVLAVAVLLFTPDEVNFVKRLQLFALCLQLVALITIDAT